MENNRSTRLRMLSQLFLRGVTPGLLPELLKSPSLAVHFPHANIAPDTAMRDEWASDHFHQLGMNVTPNASMYLDEEAMLGGATAAWVFEIYSREDFTQPAQAEGVDHVGNELAFLSFLLEADHQRIGASARLASERAAVAAQFLDEHLLIWLPLFVYALQRQGHSFYTAAAETLLREVLACAASLPGLRRPVLPEVELPAEDLLTDPDTHIRDIARFLLTPIYSGILLTRDDIARFGRSTRLPRGFGDRLQILRNLIHSAADYEMVGGVLELLEAELEIWMAYYHELGQTDYMQGVASFWAQRVRGSLQMVSRMKTEIS